MRFDLLRIVRRTHKSTHAYLVTTEWPQLGLKRFIKKPIDDRCPETMGVRSPGNKKVNHWRCLRKCQVTSIRFFRHFYVKLSAYYLFRLVYVFWKYQKRLWWNIASKWHSINGHRCSITICYANWYWLAFSATKPHIFCFFFFSKNGHY